jgi:predicted methyltransferase
MGLIKKVVWVAILESLVKIDTYNISRTEFAKHFCLNDFLLDTGYVNILERENRVVLTKKGKEFYEEILAKVKGKFEHFIPYTPKNKTPHNF